MRDVQPHPADRDADPTLHGEMLRDDGGERVFVRWVTDTPSGSPWVHLLTEESGKEDRLLSLDTIELPQAARALRAVVDDRADSAPIRDMGAFERIWLEAEGDYVTVVKEELKETAGLLVLEPSEAEHLLDTLEGIIADVDGVEDKPYV